jgi:hypothetical protein
MAATAWVPPRRKISSDRRRGDLPPDRRGARGDALHPGDLGGHDRHVSRRDERVLAAGHIGPRGGDGNVALAEEDPRLGLDLEVLQRVLLVLREAADPRLHRGDVLDDLGRHAGDDLLDLLGVEPEAVGRPAVELLRVLADGDVAPRTDVGDHLRHGLADRLEAGLVLRIAGSGFEVDGH